MGAFSRSGNVVFATDVELDAGRQGTYVSDTKKMPRRMQWPWDAPAPSMPTRRWTKRWKCFGGTVMRARQSRNSLMREHFHRFVQRRVGIEGAGASHGH